MNFPGLLRFARNDSKNTRFKFYTRRLLRRFAPRNDNSKQILYNLSLRGDAVAVAIYEPKLTNAIIRVIARPRSGRSNPVKFRENLNLSNLSEFPWIASAKRLDALLLLAMTAKTHALNFILVDCFAFYESSQ
ncbi:MULTISPECIES: hypothetical protein [unclassified Campylobacter]|uniref:hypothetical protein n=1 Tax=unclassified Campylobacter TaxID=2593542 RepID=UPI0022E9D09A|nr:MULTISPECIES: hypothetical protein [unclassified Campylobacter]MDA3054006.1 hypothetical protein [Campylobacter sp. VBCF_07 NA4]MDA3060107.1 hypothetical protein [Campylobacter sp. VBCF_02 NA5]MDA3069621.1 hypothetical protein [Campylobacter sp. VBCF_08 NA3]